MLSSCPAIMCKLCLDLLYVTHDCYVPTNIYDHPKFSSELPKAQTMEDRSAKCRCGNVAVIVDEDCTFRIYVEDIRSTQRAILYHDNFKEVHRELLQPFGYAVYSDYSSIASTPINFETPPDSKKYKRKTSTRYDTKLIHMLERHKYTTSDGKEKHKRKSV